MKASFIKVLLLILLAPALTFAQSNYKPGYVVNLKGDTLRGFIDYQEWNANPNTVNFKKTLIEPGNKYGAGDIAAFGIDKLESYTTYTGPISTDLTDPNKAIAEGEMDTSFRTGTVFLKILEKGNKVALYSYKDEIKIRFYISASPDFKPTELVYRVTRASTENTYRKQLSAEASRFNELTDDLIQRIGKSEYYLDDMLDIVSRVNHINKVEYAKSQYNGPSFNFFAGAGVNVNTTSPSQEDAFYAAGGRSYTSFGPAIMLGLNFFVNPATRKLQFRLELSAAQSSYKSLYTDKVYPYQPTEASYNEMALSASLQIIYNFYNSENFKVFGGTGLTLSHYSFSNAYLGAQDHGPSQSQIIEPYYFISQDNSFIIKGGVQFTKHLVVFIEYQSPITPTFSDYFGLTSKCERAGINYLF